MPYSCKPFELRQRRQSRASSALREAHRTSALVWAGALTGVSLLLGACAVTKVEAPEPVAAPAQFKEAQYKEAQNAATLVPGQSADAAVPDAWWELFGDAELNALERQLLIGNENLKISLAQVASARAALDASQQAMLPTFNLGLAGSRSQSQSAGSAGGGDPVNNVSLSASSSWEMDLWGRLAMAAQGLEHSAKASQADLAAATLSAQATLAQTYFSLRAAELQQQLLERSVSAYQRALELTEQRKAGGVAALSDVLQARAQWQNSRSQLADVQAQRAQLEHALAVLLGQPASSFSLPAQPKLPDPVAVPATLPARLLERRPDIAAARLRVQAAYAQIGVADAAFLPSLSLSASAGYGQSSLANLISNPNLGWSLGASLSQPLLDSGAHQQASAQARASASQITASYRQTVLVALQEVEDNLVLARRLEEQLQAQTAALQASQRNLEIVQDQYRAGSVGYLNVTAAQSAALNSEIALVTLRNRQLAAINLLLKNIAGRWDTR